MTSESPLDRQTGRTAKQMIDAPVGAVFVWCNERTDYPTKLAKVLGRDDLVVRPLSWLAPRNVMGMRLQGSVIVDHAARLDRCALQSLAYLCAHGVAVA